MSMFITKRRVIPSFIGIIIFLAFIIIIIFVLYSLGTISYENFTLCITIFGMFAALASSSIALALPFLMRDINKLEEEKKLNKRKKEIGLLLYTDIKTQLDYIKNIYKINSELKSAKSKKKITKLINILKENFNFYNDNTFKTTISELALLPTECIRNIIQYYNKSKTAEKNISECLNSKNKSTINKIISNNLNIEEYAIKAIDALNETVLKDKDMNTKFEKIIKKMEDEKLLILSFLLIFEEFTTESLIDHYKKYIETNSNFNLDEDVEGFLKKLIGKKIILKEKNIISFSNPTYYDTFLSLLEGDRKLFWFNENVFTNLLKYLSEIEEFSKEVSKFVLR